MTSSPLESVYSWYRGLVGNPKYRWWVIAGTMIYLFSPFDISPDFIPFIGQLDDALVVTLLVAELSEVLKSRSAAIKGKKAAQSVSDAPVDVEVVEVQ